MNDKLTTLKSFDLINSFPNKDLKLCNKTEQPGFHYGIGLNGIATSIETFLKENASSILNVANSSDLKMIESNLSKLDQLIKKEEEAHAHLMNAISVIQQLQQQKNARVDNQWQKPVLKTKKPKSKEALLQEIKNEVQKIDLGSPQGLKQIKELAVKVSQAKKHPEFDSHKDLSLVDLETGLGLILNPSIFSPNETEKMVINMFRNDGVDELKKEIDAYLTELKNAQPDKLLSVKINFIKALMKYQKSEHLSEPINEIAQAIRNLPNSQKKALKQLQSSITKALEDHFLDCSAYDGCEKILFKEAANDVLKILKKTDLSINTSLVPEFLRIQEKVIVTRISNITSSNSSFDPVKQLIPKIDHLKELESQCKSFLYGKIDNIHKKFDALSGNKFSELIKNYPYADLRSKAPQIIQSVLKSYCSSSKSESSISEEMIEKSINSQTHRFEAVYRWYLANLPYIQKPYNQGTDDNRNLGTGTCFENSCDREALLLTTPEIDFKDIPMGSTESGRFNTASAKIGLSKKENVKHIVMINDYLENKLHLKVKSRERLTVQNTTNNSRQHIVDQLFNEQKIPDATQSAILLLMANGKGKMSGHAINVQVIRDKHLFRFIDDNLGIVKYPTEVEFQKNFKWWLELTYSDLDVFTVITAEKKQLIISKNL